MVRYGTEEEVDIVTNIVEVDIFTNIVRYGTEEEVVIVTNIVATAPKRKLITSPI